MARPTRGAGGARGPAAGPRRARRPGGRAGAAPATPGPSAARRVGGGAGGAGPAEAAAARRRVEAAIGEAEGPAGREGPAAAGRRARIERALCELEALNPAARPAESPALEGCWEVAYSTAPPPSDGTLGPFRGAAFQDIRLADGTYVNRLAVPPGAWLGARLRAGWEALDDRRWLVTFSDVTVSLFGGRLDVFTKRFSSGTTRVWEHTYVDDAFRVVRAARTAAALDRGAARGRRAAAGDEDDCVFALRRVEPTAEGAGGG